MVSIKKLQRRVIDILNQMYEEATPPMDFEHAWNNPEEYQDDWFLEHVLSRERQEAIVKSYTIRLSKRDKAQVNMAIFNWSPKYER